MGRKPLTPEQREQKRLALNARLRDEYANSAEVREMKKKRYREKSEHIKVYSSNRYYSRKKELDELRKKVMDLESKIPQ